MGREFEFDSSVVADDDVGTRMPRRYKVIMHNDNYTPMEFVVYVLVSVFNHPEATAETLMRTVHDKGQAVAGSYPREIAETRAAHTMSLARREGYPLRCSLKAE